MGASSGWDDDGVRAAFSLARRGDVRGFNTLVETTQRPIYGLCYRTLGNVEDASDATQEAFLHAYRSFAAFQGPPEAFRAWLYRIASNACLDLLRKRRRRPSESLDGMLEPDADEAPFQIASGDPGPESQALSAETIRRVEAGLARLNPEQRLAVVLCDVQGLSYDEAAAAMAVELGTVKSRLSRARAHLREWLREMGEPAEPPQRLHLQSPTAP
ncbi:MAG: sigma-70 family RNA polymerase sigma factor [Chloroflexi bacterium]|nr:sigma-70 family RNA polymerase sigma factor [Chloroflexota bacterium]